MAAKARQIQATNHSSSQPFTNVIIIVIIVITIIMYITYNVTDYVVCVVCALLRVFVCAMNITKVFLSRLLKSLQHVSK